MKRLFYVFCLMTVLTIPGVSNAQSCDTIRTPWYEDFNSCAAGNVDSCWVAACNSVYWPAITVEKYLNCRLNTNDRYFLVLPPVDLPPDSVYFRFQAKYTGEGLLQYGIMTDAIDTNTLILIDTLPLTSNGDWVTVNFSTLGMNLSDTVRLAFKFSTETYATVMLDNFYIDRAASCNTPSMPSLVYADTVMATLRWSCVGSYAGFVLTLDDTIQLFTPDTLIDIVNLIPQHTYQYTLRTICPSGDTTPAINGLFSTFCSAMELPWIQNFNTENAYDIPMCWRSVEGFQYNTAGYPYPSVGNNHSLDFRGISDSVMTMLTPMLAYPGNALHISFDLRMYIGDTMIVGVLKNPYDISGFHPAASYVGDEPMVTGKHFDVYTEMLPDTDYAYVAFMWRSNGLSRNASIDNVMIEKADSCHNPTDLFYSSVGQHTIMLQWTDYSVAGAGYEVRFANVDDINASDSSWFTMDSWFMVDTLKVATAYWFWVRPVCLGDSGAWVPAGMVRTVCGQPTVPYFENFESYDDGEGMPCWEYYHTSPTAHNPYVKTVSYYAVSGDMVWNFDNPYSDTAMVVLPQFDINPMNLEVSFWLRTMNGDFKAGLYDTYSGVFTPVVTVSGSNGNMQRYVFQCDTVLAANQYSRIAFVWHQNYSTSYTKVAYLDNLRVRHIPYCHPPDSVTAYNCSDSSLSLHIYDSWSNGAYRVLYYPDGGVPDTAVVIGNNVTITGLQHSTYYNIEVCVLCADGTTTDSVMAIFPTRCHVITHDQLPYIETFDSYFYGNRINPCWNRHNFHPALSNSYPMPYQGVFYGGTTAGVSMQFLIKDTLPFCQIMTLPQIDYVSDLYLEFYARFSNIDGRIDVGVMTNPEADSTFYPISTVVPSTINSWTLYNVPLVNYPGTGKYVAIRAYGAMSSIYTTSAFVDNMALKVIPPCSERLTWLASHDVGNSCATVVWDESVGVNENAVYVVHVTDTMGTELFTDTTTHKYHTFCNLNDNTAYRVYVELYCDSASAAFTDDTICFITKCVEGNTVGYGTVTASTITTLIPFAHDCVMSEQIYTASELESAAGEITDISIHIRNLNAIRDVIYGAIYMCHTSDTIVVHWTPVDNMEKVYEGPINLNQGWNTLSFSRPFHYNGNDNVLVAFKTSINNSTSYLYFSSIDEYYLNSMYCKSNGSYYMSRRRNIVRFNICPDQLDICETPVISNISATDMAITVDYSPAVCEVHLTQGWWNRGFTGQMDSTGSHTFTGLNPATQYTIGVRRHCANGERSLWAIRRITTQEVIALPPLVVSVDSVGIKRATVTWRQRASESKWELRLFNNYTDIRVLLTDTTYTFDDLRSRVTYNVSIRSMCGSDYSILSPWSDTVTFTTDYCHPVSNVTVSDITLHSARVSWDPSDNGVGWKVEYGYQGFGHEEALASMLIENATSVLIDSLNEGTSYSVYVASVCGPGSSSGWVGVESFRTAGVNDIVTLTSGSGFVLYPNPATTMVTVRPDTYDLEAQIFIIDQNGRTVTSCSAAEANIDVSHLSSGIYFVRLVGPSFSSVRKLVVNR